MPKTGGMKLRCPDCAETIESEAIMCRYCKRGISGKHYHQCPFCCEMVRKTAHRCRYCKLDLQPPPQFGIDFNDGGQPPDGAPVPRPSSGPLGSKAVALPLPEPEVFVDARPDPKRFKSTEETESDSENKEDEHS